MKQYALLEAAVSCGSPTRGSELAYDALTALGLAQALGARCCPMEKKTPCGGFPPHLKCLDTVMAASRELRENVLSALEAGEFPVVIGGDHSVAMGTLAALGERYGAENVAVVYVDAHADINTEKTSVSHYIHGMDLAAACGLCCDELTVGKNKVNVLGRNIHIVGARSIDPPEFEIMAEQGVDCHSAAEVLSRGVDEILERLLPALKGKRVYISLDVDSMDPTEFFATGYQIPGGLTLAQVEHLVGAVLAEGNAVCLECVEYNPAMDEDGADGKKLVGLLKRLLER